ncbi:hypothetical protein [Streptomyces sp. NPDC048295]|uniref:hypothetical protein n=1 Tax=Streptomyces sp. NPDC048295 TaxID=3154617 RepID=UPI0034158F02
MRVLTEGRVRAGEEVVEISPGPEEMTVVEIDALLHLSGHARPQLERALRIAALILGRNVAAIPARRRGSRLRTRGWKPRADHQ